METKRDGAEILIGLGEAGRLSQDPQPGRVSEADPIYPGPWPPNWRLCQLLWSKQSFLTISQDPLLDLHPLRSPQGTKLFKGSVSSNLPINLRGRDYWPHAPVEDLEGQRG